MLGLSLGGLSLWSSCTTCRLAPLQLLLQSPQNIGVGEGLGPLLALHDVSKGLFENLSWHFTGPHGCTALPRSAWTALNVANRGCGWRPRI